MDHVTKAVLQYQKTGVLDPEAKNEIFQFIYFYPSRRMGLSEKIQAEFLLFIEPRLTRTMEGFEYQEVPFLGYLSTCLYWQSRTFFKKRGEKKSIQTYLELNPQDFPYEDDFSISILRDLEKDLRVERKLTKGENKRLIILAAKYIYYLRVDEMHILARITPMGFDFWSELQQTAEETFKNRMNRLARYQEERGKAFARAHLLDKQIERTQGIFEVADLKSKRLRLRNRISSWNNRIAKLHPVFTHKQVASLLGIPKGTVDNALHTVKKQPPAIFSFC